MLKAKVKRVIKALIIGASGYTGAELLRLLSGHSEGVVVAATSETYAGQKSSELYPHLSGQADIGFVKLSEAADVEADIIFTALPHGQSMKVVGEMFDAGKKVIDLSGDFRLESAEVYSAWYKQPHSRPELLKQAIYGLPELNKGAIGRAELVSNPGCYPTSVILGLLPVLENNLIGADDIIVNSLSGISGAGRAGNDLTHYCARSDSVLAYKTGGSHQHIPEMERYLGAAAGAPLTISFTPHLGPFSRGIYSTIYAAIPEPVSLDSIFRQYAERYAACPFVKIMPAGEMPELKAVAGSNYCHIGLAVDERAGRLIIVSAIDNLVKGASGQAIQNMNIMFGLPETTGLEQGALWP
jgi:N-acetyl-gamma-glutamyl-phosphate reductase